MSLGHGSQTWVVRRGHVHLAKARAVAKARDRARATAWDRARAYCKGLGPSLEPDSSTNPPRA